MGLRTRTGFSKIIRMLMSPLIFMYYVVNADVTIQSDASEKLKYRLSKELSTNWKETLAIRLACQKFHSCIFGKKLTIQTDHKSNQINLQKKSLRSAPRRLQGIIFFQYCLQVV